MSGVGHGTGYHLVFKEQTRGRVGRPVEELESLIRHLGRFDSHGISLVASINIASLYETQIRLASEYAQGG